MRSSVFVPGLLVAGLLGCAAPTPYDRFRAGEAMTNFPHKTGATYAEIDRAATECQISAAQRVPPNVQVHTTPTYTSPSQTYCNRIGTQVLCNTVGGDTYGGQTYSTDANEPLRQKAVQMCMGDRGYRFVSIPACPRDTPEERMQRSPKLPALSSKTCYTVTPGQFISVVTLRD